MFSIFKRKPKENPPTSISHKEDVNFVDKEAKDILLKIQEEFGLDYTKQEYITLRKIERFAIKNNIFSFAKLHESIKASQEMQEKLLNMLTVGETYFYRELSHFKVLVSLMQERKIKNILCAPSSSGEEIYSILLFVKESLHRLPSLHITGIDINSEAVKLAKEGLFSKRSVSKLPKEILEGNFRKKDDDYEISKELQHYTSFHRSNVFDLQALQKLGTFDVVFCRNMLIYFNDAQKKEAIANLRELLNERGTLFLGHADISFEPLGFKKITTSHGSYLQKN